jgi:hypothetical protein
MALIGDLRGSRHLQDRAAVQERLRRELSGLQERFAEVIASTFAITTGDEFQVLLHDPAAGLKVVVACDEALAGLRLRYGLGWGTLATRLQPEAVGMDGPCFHAARRAIEWTKKHDAWVAIRGLDPSAESTLDGLLQLLGAVRAGWTAKQARAVALRRRALTQRELALQLELDPSTVSKRLKSALYEEVTNAERSVAALLSHFTDATADAPPTPESP